MQNPLLVIGATSGIGKLCMETALDRGHSVRAFARSADNLDEQANLDRCAGDATKQDDIARALDGVGAVVVALGIRERVSMLWEEEHLFSTATKHLLQAMPEAGLKRLIVVTGFGSGRSRNAMSAIERLGHGAVLGRVYADKTRQEDLIVDSDLDWTIARPVILNNRPASGSYKVLTDPKEWRNGLISRADVAAYLVDAAEQTLNIRQDVVLTR
ncbi:NAD(P)-dependent oxidoreductase [Shimia ponticola]|uniref:NAD(P)-dependent oxidoreductase n=1 Tax=Shimia ponticola TaxID=2582893 RepID=UPI0011BE733B|nr:NAD(P)-binding oxidoreductase [Shimia ponticola]